MSGRHCPGLRCKQKAYPYRIGFLCYITLCRVGGRGDGRCPAGISALCHGCLSRFGLRLCGRLSCGSPSSLFRLSGCLLSGSPGCGCPAYGSPSSLFRLYGYLLSGSPGCGCLACGCLAYGCPAYGSPSSLFCPNGCLVCGCPVCGCPAYGFLGSLRNGNLPAHWPHSSPALHDASLKLPPLNRDNSRYVERCQEVRDNRQYRQNPASALVLSYLPNDCPPAHDRCGNCKKTRFQTIPNPALYIYISYKSTPSTHEGRWSVPVRQGSPVQPDASCQCPVASPACFFIICFAKYNLIIHS
ncbi:hypothetical protein KNP414_06400 [Paenibacillus mucilaginosus KNP414]|uniref:Uncharacterized protein n=1 Tax=Paenibacillus mucilaginosus (strain KNP414) TaxID=1036673 RepID=F8FMW1_PAEMK|nr:hypothetical protein KNP414_06400 [Paenibacillus mucilaginosus KNP414]